ALEGHTVDVAYDGQAGLLAAGSGEYDALVCDLGLPTIDGLELITRLRGTAEGQRPYAVALSGYCQDEDRTRAIAAGFDAYCVKPVDPAMLLGLLASEPCQRRRAQLAQPAA
ncbi:MAG TPA: response regulator, partial [Ramlibacter sp.]